MKALLFLLIFLSANASYANRHVKLIYEYKNNAYITEFSDTLYTQQVPVRTIEIKKTTDKQLEIINKKLEKLNAFNQDFNKRYYDNKTKQLNAARRYSEKKKKEQQDALAKHNEEVSKLSRHRKHKHLRRDRIRKSLGKKGHSY